MANRFSVLWGIFCFILLYLFAENIAKIFSQDPEVIANTVTFLHIIPIGFGAQGVVNIINANLNTINRPLQASMIIIIQMLIVGVPLLYLGSDSAGMKGIFWALVATYIVGGALSYVINRHLMNKLQRSLDKS